MDYFNFTYNLPLHIHLFLEGKKKSFHTLFFFFITLNFFNITKILEEQIKKKKNDDETDVVAQQKHNDIKFYPSTFRYYYINIDWFRFIVLVLLVLQT